VLVADRWALVGEAGAFVDPLLQPGTDFIGFANCFHDRAHARGTSRAWT
jgi:hypothetical protein